MLYLQKVYDTIEEYKALAKELEKRWREFEKRFREFIDLLCEKEEIEEIEAHFKPCLSVPLPPRTYRSFKLWRKNRALFRPYKRNI